MDYLDPAVPWMNVCSPSTTSEAEPATVRRPPKGQGQRRKATPLGGFRLWGRRTPVTLTFTLRYGADLWVEVKNHQGRFFVRHDASIVDLVRRVQEGDYYVAPPPSTTKARQRAKGAASKRDR